jgi:hypothetical protein
LFVGNFLLFKLSSLCGRHLCFPKVPAYEVQQIGRSRDRQQLQSSGMLWSLVNDMLILRCEGEFIKSPTGLANPFQVQFRDRDSLRSKPDEICRVRSREFLRPLLDLTINLRISTAGNG